MILADENIPASMLKALEGAGFSVVIMASVNQGASDVEVLAYATANGLVVLTRDKDFGELVFHQGAPHAGVVLVRLRGMPFAEQAELVVAAMREYRDDLSNLFLVVSKAGVRIRS